MKRGFLFAAISVAVVGCGRHTGSSSASIDHARRRELLIAEYDVPADSQVGKYRVLECWIERDPELGERQLAVRLKGPHHDDEPRVIVDGLRYRTIWSERNGSPYEIWDAPEPSPEALTLRNGQEELTIRLRKDSLNDG